jgi:hypothetical protein
MRLWSKEAHGEFHGRRCDLVAATRRVVWQLATSPREGLSSPYDVEDGLLPVVSRAGVR